MVPERLLSRESHIPFDGDRAFADLVRLCELGPRPAGSKANARQRRRVAGHFQAKGGTILEQPVSAWHPLTGEPVAMANLVGRWFPERTERVLIGAHGDTRPLADLEPDPDRWDDPFIGANDGASGVAVLMELARGLGAMNTPWGVDLVVFDGEELVFGTVGEYCLGSQALAESYRVAQASGTTSYRYRAAIVLDMVGGESMNLEQEGFSLDHAPELVAEVWERARVLGADVFQACRGLDVIDDHLPLIEAGIPAIDLIDINYPQWHTTQDLPEHCSARSLEQVGKVVTAWLMDLKSR